MVTNMAAKIGKWPFWTKVETCNREINIEHKQIPKKNILTYDENYQGTQYTKKFFGVCLCFLGLEVKI